MSSSELSTGEMMPASKCGDSFWGIGTNELGKTDTCSLLVRSHLALGISCQWPLSKRRLLPGALPQTYLTCPVFLCLTICSSRNQEGWIKTGDGPEGSGLEAQQARAWVRSHERESQAHAYGKSEKYQRHKRNKGNQLRLFGGG